MNFERFIKNNLVKKQKPDFKQITDQLNRAKKDLHTAASISSIDLTWSFAIAYHAMIRAGKALMFSQGYLPTAKQSHKTIVEITSLILGTEYETLINRFNRMRRRRHDFIYDAINQITGSEVKAAIDTAKKLIDNIADRIKQENPQLELFK